MKYRIKTFHNILDLLNKDAGIKLYNLKEKKPGSVYNGDYGLLKTYEDIHCLFGIKHTGENIYVPQSWMASKRENKLVSGKPPIYFKKTTSMSLDEFEKYKEKEVIR